MGGMDIEEGVVDGDELTRIGNMTSPMPMKLEFSATVDGDEISGEAKLGTFGTAALTADRA